MKTLILALVLTAALTAPANAQYNPNPLGLDPLPSGPVCKPVYIFGQGYQIVCQ